jgi:hypothetical protein
MDVFDKREKVLELQQEMLIGAKERDNSFLSLVKFENWCCNSGLSGFVQDFQESELKTINDFGIEHKFITINNMISVVQKFISRYGKNFIDKLNEEEFKSLSQYDDNFYDTLDQYTDAVYKKYVNEK